MGAYLKEVCEVPVTGAEPVTSHHASMSAHPGALNYGLTAQQTKLPQPGKVRHLHHPIIPRQIKKHCHLPRRHHFFSTQQGHTGYATQTLTNLQQEAFQSTKGLAEEEFER
ncbi:hypothetical protein CDAR_168191 [Caerostris darwini]|uniref:Uncharacterized protein n=1 Tax=Caerostris darwini TaxID=1538125 RepID=A0AAV4T6W8_9ARAC|nr:hypothetical protein CDAR_168191 [Caerostris darwini]